MPSLWLVAPFVVLLAMIALVPFLAGEWWEHHFPKVASGLGALVAIYYVAILGNAGRMLDAGHEYVSFLALVGSLFVVSGGIHLRVRGEAGPLGNVALLGFGALLANVVGTTGASMLLIRPYLRMNKARASGYHVVFFIFLVSNVGGGLTPIGDPPLFVGYLKGVPFFWVAEHCWAAWAMCVGLLLAVFYAVDLRNFRREPARLQHRAEHDVEEWSFRGGVNLLFLAMIVGSVFVTKPLFLREAIMIAAAGLSLWLTPRATRAMNHFTWHPVREVGWLFLGIFATMVPALDLLALHSRALGLDSEMKFYWFTGFLSGVLDNVPTYLTFLTAAMGNEGLSVERAADVARFVAGWDHTLVAISVAAVFFGAFTYIGNAPNFMVKSIAEKAGVRVPGFLPYVWRYSVPVLLPIFAIIALVFFRFRWL